MNNITIVANSSNDANQQLINESATVEAYDGDINLYTEELINRKAKFEVSDGKKVSGVITYICGKCRNNIYADYVVEDVYHSEIKANSPVAKIVAGNDLFLTGDSLLNQHSLIAADRNIDISLGVSLENISSAKYKITKTKTYSTASRTKLRTHRNLVSLINKYNERNSPVTTQTLSGGKWRPYTVLTSNKNPNFDSSKLLPVPSQILGYRYSGVTEAKTNTGQASSAAIQAVGRAIVTVAGQTNNTDVKENATNPTHTSRTAATTANGKGLKKIDPSHIGTVTDSIESINALNGVTAKIIATVSTATVNSVKGQPGTVDAASSSASATPEIEAQTEDLALATYNPADKLELSKTDLITHKPQPSSGGDKALVVYVTRRKAIAQS